MIKLAGWCLVLFLVFVAVLLASPLFWFAWWLNVDGAPFANEVGRSFRNKVYASLNE